MSKVDEVTTKLGSFQISPGGYDFVAHFRLVWEVFHSDGPIEWKDGLESSFLFLKLELKQICRTTSEATILLSESLLFSTDMPSCRCSLAPLEADIASKLSLKSQSGTTIITATTQTSRFHVDALSTVSQQVSNPSHRRPHVLT